MYVHDVAKFLAFMIYDHVYDVKVSVLVCWVHTLCTYTCTHKVQTRLFQFQWIAHCKKYMLCMYITCISGLGSHVISVCLCFFLDLQVVL